MASACSDVARSTRIAARIVARATIGWSGMATFNRLLGFLRPYRSGVILSFVLAAAAMVASVAIPWLVGRAIDSIRAHDHTALRNYAIAVAGCRPGSPPVPPLPPLNRGKVAPRLL